MADKLQAERQDVVYEEKGAINTTNSQSGVQSAKIQNPLMHMSEAECIQDVHTFATEYGFESERDLLVKGALISRDPTNFANVPGMTDDEKSAIANEVLHKWRQPRFCILPSFSAPSVQLYKAGTRPGLTVPTCHSLWLWESLQKTIPMLRAINGIKA